MGQIKNTDVSSADSGGVVDFHTAPSLTDSCHVLHHLHTAVVQSAKEREWIVTAL